MAKGIARRLRNNLFLHQVRFLTFVRNDRERRNDKQCCHFDQREKSRFYYDDRFRTLFGMTQKGHLQEALGLLL